MIGLMGNSFTMSEAMARFFCWIAVLIIGLGGASCRENAASINKKAHKAFISARTEEAARLYSKTLRLEPDNPQAHFYLGWIYRGQGKSEEAISEFKKAVAANPAHALAYGNLGDLYLEKVMLVEAIDAYMRAVAINPESENAYYGLGIAYEKQGDLTEAAKAFFEAGLLAVMTNNKDLALNAYNHLKEAGNTQIAAELQGVLRPWFDPVNEVPAPPKGGRRQH